MAAFTLQDAFGGPPEEEPQTAVPQTNFAVEPALVDDLKRLRSDQQPSADEVAALREQQQASMTEHQRFAQSRQQMAGQLETRSADLEATRGFLQATDAQLSRPARNFAMRGWLKSQGIDPNSPSAKELTQLASSLPPNELSALRGAIVDASSNAPAGSMVQLYKAIGTGQISPGDLLTRVGDFQSRQAATTGEEVAQAFPVADRSPSPLGARVPTPPNTELPNIEREVPSEITNMLGFEVGRRMTVREVQEKFPHIASDDVGMRKFATDYREGAARTITALSQIRDMQILLDKGGAAAVGVPGFLNRLQDVTLDTVSGLTGIARELLPDPGSRNIANALDATAQQILSSHKIKGDAETAARVRSGLAAMAYSTARSQDPSGKISDADIIAALRTIGASASVGQFSASLNDHSNRLYGEFTDRMSTAAGGEVGLNTSRMSRGQLAAFVDSPTTPRQLRSAITAELETRAAREAPRPEQQSDPNAPAAAPRTQRQLTDIEQREAAARAEFDRANRRTTGRENAADSRAEETLQLNREGQARQADQFERTFQRQAEQFKLQYDRAAKWRAEDTAEKQQARIQKAIQEFAKAIGQSAPKMSVPRGGGGGGGQDAGAFKLPAKPQRQAPRIPNLPLTGFGGIKPGGK